jgi:hypothetical protein
MSLLKLFKSVEPTAQTEAKNLIDISAFREVDNPRLDPTCGLLETRMHMIQQCCDFNPARRVYTFNGADIAVLAMQLVYFSGMDTPYSVPILKKGIWRKPNDEEGNDLGKIFGVRNGLVRLDSETFFAVDLTTFSAPFAVRRADIFGNFNEIPWHLCS